MNACTGRTVLAEAWLAPVEITLRSTAAGGIALVDWWLAPLDVTCRSLCAGRLLGARFSPNSFSVPVCWWDCAGRLVARSARIACRFLCGGGTALVGRWWFNSLEMICRSLCAGRTALENIWHDFY